MSLRVWMNNWANNIGVYIIQQILEKEESLPLEVTCSTGRTAGLVNRPGGRVIFTQTPQRDAEREHLDFAMILYFINVYFLLTYFSPRTCEVSDLQVMGWSHRFSTFGGTHGARTPMTRSVNRICMCAATSFPVLMWHFCTVLHESWANYIQYVGWVYLAGLKKCLWVVVSRCYGVKGAHRPNILPQVPI